MDAPINRTASLMTLAILVAFGSMGYAKAKSAKERDHGRKPASRFEVPVSPRTTYRFDRALNPALSVAPGAGLQVISGMRLGADFQATIRVLERQTHVSLKTIARLWAENVEELKKTGIQGFKDQGCHEVSSGRFTCEGAGTAANGRGQWYQLNWNRDSDQSLVTVSSAGGYAAVAALRPEWSVEQR